MAAPPTFTNQARLAKEDGDEVAESAEGDEEVETPDRTAGAEDFLEEQAGGDLCRVLELRCRNCFDCKCQRAFVHFWRFFQSEVQITHQRQSTQYSPTDTKWLRQAGR